MWNIFLYFAPSQIPYGTHPVTRGHTSLCYYTFDTKYWRAGVLVRVKWRNAYAGTDVRNRGILLSKRAMIFLNEIHIEVLVPATVQQKVEAVHLWKVWLCWHQQLI